MLVYPILGDANSLKVILLKERIIALFFYAKVQEDWVPNSLYPSLCDSSPDSLLDLIEFDGWFATGACVEVDLRKFTGITCFPPTTTMSPSASDLTAGIQAVKALRANHSG